MHVLVPAIGRPHIEGNALDWSAPLVFTIPQLCTAAECAALIERAETLGLDEAPITTAAGFEMRPDIRNNTRVMFDEPPLAAALFTRIADAVPAQLFGRHPVGVNERFRIYRYEPGQRFAPHFDGAFQRNARERSELTFMIYLNDGFVGGETAFLDHDVVVAPRTGHALLFQHLQLHEGRAVVSGRKYALRSDIMYAE
jgi:prolyl 4-hydroxylase